MKSPKKFAFFASLRNLDAHVETYKQIHDVLEQEGCYAVDSWVVDQHPHTDDVLKGRITSFSDDTHRMLAKAEFAVADFSEASRMVFFQCMLAKDAKIPLLCVVKDDKQGNIAESIYWDASELVTVKTYHDSKDLEKIIKDFLDCTGTLKKRFNIMLNTTTLKELEILSQKLGQPKADVIRQLISKKYYELFEK